MYTRRSKAFCRSVFMGLILKDLRKAYAQGTNRLEILKGINAQVADAEVIAIVGQSGSGKSTLLSLLAGLDRPDSGQIYLKNNEINRYSEEQMTKYRAKNIGIVFQQFHLMSHLTALENVMLPLEILGEADIEDRSLAMLEQLGLKDRKTHLPSQLSGGECQRVAIARALVVKPQLLLADEPSGNLDTETGEMVMNVFFEVVRKNRITTVLVTHSESLAARCDRKLVLSNGAL